MALIIPPGYLQAAYIFALAGDSDPIVVTCGHEIDGASGANGEDAPDDLFNAFSTTLLTVVSNQYNLTAVDCYVGQDAAAPLVYTSSTSPVTGGALATPLPQNCAMLIRKRTDLGGRRGRGRMYLPGCGEAVVGPTGVLDGDFRNGVQTQADAFMAALTTAVGARYYPPVVLHRSEGIGVEPLPTPIEQFVVDGVIATQRRRLRK